MGDRAYQFIFSVVNIMALIRTRKGWVGLGQTIDKELIAYQSLSYIGWMAAYTEGTVKPLH